MRIMGIDPGSKRTGVCLLEADDEGYGYDFGSEIYGGVEGMVEHLHLSGGIYRPDAIVIEGYEIRRQAGDPHGLEVIGAVKYWASVNGMLPPIIQSASGRKVAVSDDALKRLGLHFSGEPNRNLKEAVRQAVVYAKNMKIRSILIDGWG